MTIMKEESFVLFVSLKAQVLSTVSANLEHGYVA